MDARTAAATGRMPNVDIRRVTPQRVSQDIGLLSMGLPSPFGDVAGLLADGIGYAANPKSLTPASGLLSLAGLAPGVPSGFGLRKEASGILERKIGDATLIYKNHPDMVEIISLRVPQKKRRMGSARAAMAQFLEEADASGIPVKLQASPLDAKTNPNLLVRFYESLGFEKTGTRINQAGDPEMVRPPK